MTRWTFRILLCLLLGVVTTVGVAATICLFATVTYEDDRARAAVGGEMTQFVGVWASDGIEIIGLTRVQWPTNTPSSLRDVVDDAWADCLEGELDKLTVQEYGVSTEALVLRAGWPFKSLYCTHTEETGLKSSQVGRGGIDTGGTPHPIGIILPRYIPLFVEPRPFSFNTLFYAVIWFGLFFGVGAVRRRIRRGRGRCVKCGYDLRGTPEDVGGPGAGCSECGWGREDVPMSVFDKRSRIELSSRERTAWASPETVAPSNQMWSVYYLMFSRTPRMEP